MFWETSSIDISSRFVLFLVPCVSVCWTGIRWSNTTSLGHDSSKRGYQSITAQIFNRKVKCKSKILSRMYTCEMWYIYTSHVSRISLYTECEIWIWIILESRNKNRYVRGLLSSRRNLSMINNLNSSNILALIAWFLQVSNSAVYHLSIMISKYCLYLHPLPPQTFREGIITLCKVIAIARRKPKGDEPDIQPKRNEENGMWQCPLCLRDNFPELSEIWNHFDTTGL